MRFPHSACAILSVLTGAASAHATLMAYEPFDYAAGPLTGAAGGMGFSGAWGFAPGFDVLAPGLSAPGTITSSGNALHVAPTASPQILRTLSTSIPLVGDTWVSFVHQRSDPFFIAQWLVVGGLMIGSTANGSYGITNYPGGLPQDSHVPFAGRDPDLLVAHMRLVGGAPTLDLYLNPTNGPINPILSTSTSPIWSGLSIGVSTQFGSGSGTFDEIRIGTTFLDVAIPAPGTWCGLCAAGMLAAMRRRR